MSARSGTPGDSVLLGVMRTSIPNHLRIGAQHELWPDLAHIAQAFADLGRYRIAAAILGHLDTDGEDLDLMYHDLPALHDQLLAELGATNLATMLPESQSQPIADIARLAIDAIDGLAT